MELYSSLNNQIFLMLTSHKQDHWVVGVVVRPCWSTKTNENDQKAPSTIRYLYIIRQSNSRIMAAKME